MNNVSNSRWSVGFASIFAVIGTNSENANLDNPRGEIVREQYFAQAEDVQGNRRVWGGNYDTPEAAEAAFVALAPPVPFWEVIEPAYGSEAYAANWQEYEANQIDHEMKIAGVR